MERHCEERKNNRHDSIQTYIRIDGISGRNCGRCTKETEVIIVELIISFIIYHSSFINIASAISVLQAKVWEQALE